MNRHRSSTMPCQPTQNDIIHHEHSHPDQSPRHNCISQSTGVAVCYTHTLHYRCCCLSVASPGFCVRGGHRFGVLKRPKIINVYRTTPGSNLYSRCVYSICVVVLGLCVIHIVYNNKMNLHESWKNTDVLISSADADKPARHVWGSVKVTKHGTIRCVRYGFLLVCYSKFVRKTHIISEMTRYSAPLNGDISMQWHRHTPNPVFKVTAFFDKFNFKNAATLKAGLGVYRCHCMEISPFNRARGSISCRFWVLRTNLL